MKLLLDRPELLRSLNRHVSALAGKPAASTRKKLISQLTTYCAAWHGFTYSRCGELFDISARQPRWRLDNDYRGRLATTCPHHAYDC